MLGHLTPWKKNNFNKTPWKNPKNYPKAPGNLSQNTPWKSSSTPLYGYKMKHPITGFSDSLQKVCDFKVANSNITNSLATSGQKHMYIVKLLSICVFGCVDLLTIDEDCVLV